MKKVRVALVGAGTLQNNIHLPSLARMDDVEMVGLCDLVPEKLRETAERFEIENTFADYRAMLEATSPDAVYVVMPPHHLFDLAIHVLKQGLHLFIEKPPGVTTQQTRRLAQAAEKHGCLTMTGFQRRFIPILRELRTRIEEKGPVHSCVATYYKNWEEGPYYDGAIDILTCDCIHAVDLLRWMSGGEAKSVVGDVRCLHDNYETAFYAMVKFDNDVVGMLLGNWKTGGRVQTFEMHSHGASAFVEPDEGGTLIVDEEKQRFDTAEVAGSDELIMSHGFFQEDRHFIDCVKAGQQPLTNFADAVKTMELVDMIYQNPI